MLLCILFYPIIIIFAETFIFPTSQQTLSIILSLNQCSLCLNIVLLHKAPFLVSWHPFTLQIKQTKQIYLMFPFSFFWIFQFVILSSVTNLQDSMMANKPCLFPLWHQNACFLIFKMLTLLMIFILWNIHYLFHVFNFLSSL